MVLIDPTLGNKHQKDCADYLQSLDREKACQVASAHNGNKLCKIYRPEVELRGSYNVCFAVVFKSDTDNGDEYTGEKWIVRVPFIPQTAFVEEKMRAEIGTIKYLTERTKIPIPKLYAYCLTSDNPLGVPYTLMEYIEGCPLDVAALYEKPEDDPTMNHCFDQLFNIYAELFDQKFDHIGCLSIDDDGDWFFGNARPLPPRLIDMEVAKFDPEDIIPPGRTFSSTIDFIFALVRLAFREFERDRYVIEESSGGPVFVYLMHTFREKVFPWVKPELNYGPFILMHGDLFSRNIMVDDDYNIKAVIDWECAYTVPAQLFLPPIWICGRTHQNACFQSQDLELGLTRFMSRANLQARKHGLIDEVSDHPVVALWNQVIGSPICLGDFVVGQALYRLADLLEYCICYLDKHLAWPESPIRLERLQRFYSALSLPEDEWGRMATAYNLLRDKRKQLEDVERECQELGIDITDAFGDESDNDDSGGKMDKANNSADVRTATPQVNVENVVATDFEQGVEGLEIEDTDDSSDSIDTDDKSLDAKITITQADTENFASIDFKQGVADMAEDTACVSALLQDGSFKKPRHVSYT